ncbi:MAG: hypothetical protein CFE24_10150 [Flavobacterium sp. BFFFF2]|nr:MAG: hypothetical protein CFE24_10150 [Flavobacterium sp. BFFFF2]
MVTDDKNVKFIKDNGEELDQVSSKLFCQFAEVRPYFYGGREAFNPAINKLIDYQKIKNHSGKVTVKFAVSLNGMVEGAEISASTDPFLNEEAIRIISSLPRWQPGFQYGRFVKCWYLIPITF